jgi:hypothetical protein
MKIFTITVQGKSQSDIEMALDEVKKLIQEDFYSGMNSNDTGEFSFDSDGMYEEEEEEN